MGRVRACAWSGGDLGCPTGRYHRSIAHPPEGQAARRAGGREGLVQQADVPITDDDLSGRALVAEILRFRPDDHARKQMIVSAERRIAGQGDIILKPSAASDLDVRANDAVVADTNFFVEFRTRIHDGGMGYDCGHTNQLSRIDLIDMMDLILKLPALSLADRCTNLAIVGPFDRSFDGRCDML